MILGLRTRVYTPSELCNFTEGVMYENYATLFITPLHFPTGAGGPFHIPEKINTVISRKSPTLALMFAI